MSYIKSNNYSKSLIGFLVALLPMAISAEDIQPISKFKSISWEIPYYYDTPACRDFMDDLVNNQEEFEVIPPAVETTDWNHPQMQQYLGGCRKEVFTKLEEQNPVKVSKDEVVHLGTDRFLYAMERFALWELKSKNSPVDGKNLLLYVGPRYDLKETDNQGKSTKKFIYGGSIHELSQPGCKKILSQTEGIAFPDSEIRLRESQLIKYKGKTILLVVKNGAWGKNLYRLSSIELLGGGKAKKHCSIHQKEIN